MKLLCSEGIVLQELLAGLWDEVSVPTQGRSGEQHMQCWEEYPGIGSAEENESRFFTEAVRHVDLGLLPSLTSWWCVQSPDPSWG